MRTLMLLITIFLSVCRLDAQQITIIRNVNIWDGTSDKTKIGYEVLIENNIIKRVDRNIAVPDGSSIIDGKGGTLIPGLSDAHVHLSANGQDYFYDNSDYIAVRSTIAAKNFLMAGFTTVRDLGGPVMGLKKAIDEGLISGPRIYPSGSYISQTSGHGDGFPEWINDSSPLGELIVDGVPEILKATRINLKRGASQIKVYAGGGVSSEFDPIHSIQFTAEELKAAVQATEDWGTYVTVHAYTPESIMRALNAGVKCIEHGQLINEEAILLLKEKGAWLVPQSKWSMRPDPDWNKLSNFELIKAKKSFLVNQGANTEMILAKKHNIKLAFGTDQYGKLGSEYEALNEFTSRVRWFSPLEVLTQATSNNAQLFSLSGKINPYPGGKLGVVEPGAYADLLIYSGNPLEDISIVVDYEENLKLIMKDGEIYKNELDGTK